MRICCVVFAVLAALAVSPCRAEVLDSAANGFTVRQSVVVAADQAAVYGASVDRFSEWWDADHSITGVADNLYIKAVPGGCFCERIGSNGGLIHMTVSFVNPGVMLRFTGGLGPLGLMGVNGNMTWEFEEHDEGTLVTWNYAVGGYMSGGLDTIASAVDGVLGDALGRLQRLLDTGSARSSP